MEDEEELGDQAAFPEEEVSVHSSLLTCSFNQDGGCLAIGTTSGFSVHNLHPQYSVSVTRELRGGIGLVEMLFRCNLMALVGGGPHPHGAPHRVLIWDDHLPKEIGELSFRQVVLRVKLRKDAIAVALRDRVYVYHLADLSLRDKIYTADNPHGLLSLSTQVQDMVLACPSVTTGHVRVELYALRKTVLLEAHEGMLRGLALTADGSKLVTASTKGTVLRVWHVATSTCLQEFRRGVERATITCLCWSWDYQWLSCCSDKGTAHVFFVGDHNHDNNNNNNTLRNKDHHGGDKKSNHNDPNNNNKSSFTKKLFSTVRKSVKGDTKKYSVCQVRGVPHPLACAFVVDAPNVLAVAGWDADGNGVLLLSEFAANQEARRIAYHVLVKTSSPTFQDGLGQPAQPAETEEERRRRRLRGWKPTIPPTPLEGRVFCGERGDQEGKDTLEQGMQQIHFEDKGEFVTITTTTHNHQEEEDMVENTSSSATATTTTTAASAPSSKSKPVINDDPPDSQRDMVTTAATTTTTDSDKSHYIPKDGMPTATSNDGTTGNSAPLQDSVGTEPLDDPEQHPNGTIGTTTLQKQHLEAEAEATSQ